MTNTAIKIDNLGKKYTLAQRQGGSHYVALRDVISDVGKQLVRNPVAMFKKKMTQADFWALKDIDLTIEKGDRLAIIGHNGAGKSTLLKILSQITEPTTGRIELYGRVASLLEVGTGFHPELSGRENIFLNGSILGMSRSEVRRKFDEIVDFAGVEKFLDLPVKRYSSGMRARLGFSVAAHLESEILIIDEVLAVGDAAFQKKCLGKMDEVSKSDGRTILFVSHNMAAVQSLCSRGVVLNQGSLVFDGSLEKAVTLYHEMIDTGNGDVRVSKKNESIFLDSYENVGVIQSGKDWDYSVTFYADRDFGKCCFDFDVYSRKLARIFHYSSKATAYEVEIKKGFNTINLHLPTMSVNSGEYFSALFLTKVDGDVLFDAIDLPVAQVVSPYPFVTAESVLSLPCQMSVKHEKENKK